MEVTENYDQTHSDSEVVGESKENGQHGKFRDQKYVSEKSDLLSHVDNFNHDSDYEANFGQIYMNSARKMDLKSAYDQKSQQVETFSMNCNRNNNRTSLDGSYSKINRSRSVSRSRSRSTGSTSEGSSYTASATDDSASLTNSSEYINDPMYNSDGNETDNREKLLNSAQARYSRSDDAMNILAV